MSRALLAAGIVAGLALSACGDDGDNGSSSGASASPWSGTVAGLCTAAEEARAGDADAAETTFFDEAHDDLHELADETAAADRAAAADLLRAKEAVESDFASPSPALATDLDTLVTATRDAVGAIGAPVPPECGS
ncbi:MAG TPA: hypothetical protein VF152_03300 [Acidimicrobiia bacterium]